jgi:hypothetical protein
MADRGGWGERRRAPSELPSPSHKRTGNGSRAGAYNAAQMAIDDRKFKRLKVENVDKAPRKPGVYALYDDKALIYLGRAAGKTDTLRSRLRTHLGAQPDGATRYKRELSEEPDARLKALLKEYTVAHGKPPRGNFAKA